MKKILLVYLLLLCKVAFTQNLIPNSSFELHNGCPSNYSQLDSLQNWFNPTLASPDYYNACATSTLVRVPDFSTGYQVAYHGNAYAGLYIQNTASPGYREYIAVRLNNPMVQDTLYELKVYASLLDTCRFTSYNIGFHFSDTIIHNIQTVQVLNLPPHISNATTNLLDSVNWKLISGIYKAKGGEQYMLVGNFSPDSNTLLQTTYASSNHSSAYALLDGFSLEKIQAFPESVNNVEEKEISVYPNPSNGQITIKSLKLQPLTMDVYEYSGRRVKRIKFSNSESTQVLELSSGLYYYLLTKRGQIPLKRGHFVIN